MTATLDPPRTFPRLAPDHPAPLLTRMSEPVGRGWSVRWRGVAWLVPVLVIAAYVHARGMANYPRWVDDPGTYLSQAWAVQYQHSLSPYTYFYDHAPGGWIQIALWSMLTDGFDRYDTAIAFGNECMLLAKLASVGLLYWLGRRLGFARAASAAVGLIFALSPLALAYTRWTFLDNLVTPWILLAFALALSRRKTMIGAIGAGLAFAMAALTKETSLVLLPAFLWAIWQNSDRRNRAHVLVMTGGLATLLMSSYVVYAVTKGELFDGPGHTSLLGTAEWQLFNRQSSGSVFDAGSAVNTAFLQWLRYDPFLLVGGALTVPLLLFVPRVSAPVACLVLEAGVLIKGGYVPAMHVVTFLPWCALLLVASFEVLRGNPDLPIRRWHRRRTDAEADTVPLQVVRRPAPHRGARTMLVALVLGGLLAPVSLAWTPSLVSMTTVTAPPELEIATRWVAANVPRTDVVVVHDAIWTDLVQQYGFHPEDVIMAYKIDADPAVHARLTHLNYLVVPDWYYTAQSDKYPTLIEARKHAVAEAHFGTGADAVTVWRVSRGWTP